MKQYLERCWKSNFLFSLLFMVSFVMAILLLYYGMELYTRQFQYQKNQHNGMYSYEYDLIGEMPLLVEELGEIVIPEINQGNLYRRATIHVTNTDFLDTLGSTMILLVQNEPINETLWRGHYPNEDELEGEPCAVIGQGFLDCSYVRDGKRYININDVDFYVVGIFDLYATPNHDTRLLLFWENIPSGIQKELFVGGNSPMSSMIITSSHSITEEMKDEIRQSMELFLNNPDAEISEYEYQDHTIMTSEMYANLYVIGANVYLVIVALFSFISICILVKSWGKEQSSRWTIMLVSGYKKRRIYGVLLREIFGYELQAFIVSGIMIIVFHLFTGTLYRFATVMLYAGWLGIFVLSMGVFLSSLLPVLGLLKMKPAIVLKNVD